jgi:hypothetical protein
MSISGIPSSSNPYSVSAGNNNNPFRTDFTDLANALSSGNLSAAQSAFSAIQQLQPGRFGAAPSSTSAGSTGSTSPISADFAALGKALQSGDLNGAQAALKQLQQDLGSARQAHHHHHHKRATGAQPTDASSQNDDTNNPLGGGQVGLTA